MNELVPINQHSKWILRFMTNQQYTHSYLSAGFVLDYLRIWKPIALLCLLEVCMYACMPVLYMHACLYIPFTQMHDSCQACVNESCHA